jgi:hypothetical protein
MIDTAAQRTGLLLVAAAAAYLPANPLVRLEAVLGLSPAPLERYLGIKSVFSGMTEGMHRLVHGELNKALEANILTPLVACVLLCWAVKGGRLTTRRQERCAALLFIGLSALVNIVHPLP